MKSVTLVGLLLIVLGLGSLTYHGVSHFGAAAVICGAAIVLATARGRALAV